MLDLLWLSHVVQLEKMAEKFHFCLSPCRQRSVQSVALFLLRMHMLATGIWIWRIIWRIWESYGESYGNHMGIISGSFDRLKNGAQRHHRSLWLRFRCGRPRSSSYRCICGNCYAPDSNFCRRLGLGLKKRWLDSSKIEKPHWQ